MVPLKSDGIPSGFPFATVSLILLCCAAYLFRGLWPQFTGGVVPLDLMYALFHPTKGFGAAMGTLVLAFFVHAGVFHLVSNMWYLWIFGAALELTTGIGRYVALYGLCGVLSMLSQAFSSPLSAIPVVGASGAIAGIMGAFLVILPLSRILLWAPPVFFFRVPAFVFLLLWVGLQYINMRFSPAQTPVAWWAHLGGFGCGVCLGLWVRQGGQRRSRRGRNSARASVKD